MNYRMIFHTTGSVAKITALLLLLPCAVALMYLEFNAALALVITAAITAAIGFTLTLVFKPRSNVIFSKEGLITVALAWMFVSAVGALPFVISGEIPSYTDALFETVSGFSTTGATILHGEQIEAMSHGLLFWRSFTHWIGGMGVLVFVMAVTSKSNDRSMHILRAEMPGPVVDKLVPRARDTAKILYLIYIAMTVLEVVMLLFGGMSLFDSVVLSFGTAGTGGLTVTADGIASYNAYCQWVIAVFMLLFGVNFNLYYLMLIRKFKSAFSSTELWVYLGIVTVSIAAICVNVYSLFGNFGEALRHSAFQVISFMTTTGYSTTAFNDWPVFSKSILFVLMFIGGCAGSTAGGLKVFRATILFKAVRCETRRVLHPRTSTIVKMDGKRVSDSVISGTATYFAVYMLCIIAVFLLLCVDKFDIETNFTATVSCVNNIGPYFSHATGLADPSSFGEFSVFSKWVLVLAMLMGRLELYPMLLMFTPSTWLKK